MNFWNFKRKQKIEKWVNSAGPHFRPKASACWPSPATEAACCTGAACVRVHARGGVLTGGSMAAGRREGFPLEHEGASGVASGNS
jgi:hypothetical protein